MVSSSIQAVPAMSRCAQAGPSTNCSRNLPAVIAEAGAPPEFTRSAVEERICTSHVERSNWTLRGHLRRMTRLSNGFSRKRANLRAALALYFAYYNFCRMHKSIRMTPAMAAGITRKPWAMADLLAAAQEATA